MMTFKGMGPIQSVLGVCRFLSGSKFSLHLFRKLIRKTMHEQQKNNRR